MKIILFVWWFIQLIIGFNLIFPIVLSLLNLFFRRKDFAKSENKPEPDYALIVATYEQTQQLPDVVASILKMNYSNYLVYIVADNCDISGLNFSDERIILLRPDEILASNTRSHFYAIKNFKRSHLRLAIIDNDNLVDPEYLNELNKYFSQGYEAVQGLRKAKNLDTSYACLDAARDIYYHYYDGKMLFGAGSSATLSGSGMAFSLSLYQESLGHLDITGAGFDKVLQHAIVSKGYRIAFNENAVVYDEKTSEKEQLVKQRSRWINTWFRYFKFGFLLLFQGITKFNWNQFLFGLVLLRPPLFIFLILSVVFLVINLWIQPAIALIWFAGICIFILGFLLALFKSSVDRRIIKSLKNIPVFVFYQIISLLSAGKANKLSVATKHNYRNASGSKDEL